MALRNSSLTLLLLLILHHHRRLGRCRCALRFVAVEEEDCLFGYGGDDFVGFGIWILFAYT